MDRHIKEVLNQYLSEGKISSGFTAEKIRLVWKEIMGRSVEKYTGKIKFYEGQLTIPITSSVLKYELIQNTPQIIERLNEALQADVIVDIRFA